MSSDVFSGMRGLQLEYCSCIDLLCKFVWGLITLGAFMRRVRLLWLEWQKFASMSSVSVGIYNPVVLHRNSGLILTGICE